MRVSVIIAAVALLATTGLAQSPCPGWTMTWGWDALPDVNSVYLNANPNASPLTNGPEDITYHPQTDTLVVIQDNPGTTPDILVQYDLDGTFLGGGVNLPGVGGLCAHPNGNLLVSYANIVREVDLTGTPVTGGINVTAAGYGNIQDLDFDANGNLWIHDGNAGDWSILDLNTGIPTTQFVTGFGGQGFAFRGDNGNIVTAGAFFNSGSIGTDTLVEIDPSSGNLVCQGASANSQNLAPNGDTCTTGGGTMQFYNGMTWVDSTKELAVDAFSPFAGVMPIYPSINVARFAPSGTAYAGKLGLDGTRTTNSMPYRISASGDPVLGSSDVTLHFMNNDPSFSLLFGASVARNCNNPLIESMTNSFLYIDPFAPNGFFFVLPVGMSPTVDFTIATSGAPVSLAGLDFFIQGAISEAATGLFVSSGVIRLHPDIN